MRDREQCNRKMAEISRPLDFADDTFASLFSKDDPAKSQEGETVFVRRLKQARTDRPARILEQNSDVAHPSKTKTNRTVYALPAAVIGFCGVFFVGFYGGNFAGDQIRNKNAALPVNVSAPIVSSAEIQKNTAKTEVGNSNGNSTIAMASNSGVSSRLKTKVVGLVPGQDVPVARGQNNIGQSSIESPIPATREAAVALLLVAGHRLEKSGDISGARKKFKQAALAGNSAGALALARSYDHRSQQADSQFANSKLARQWYEKWFLMAIEKGEISPRARYDRLLKGIEKT